MANRGTNEYGAAIWRMGLNRIRRHNEIIIYNCSQISLIFGQNWQKTTLFCQLSSHDIM